MFYFLPRIKASRLDILLIILCAAGTSATTTPFLNPGFFFDYNKPGQPVPIPVTEQCETIHITWGRSTAQGPNPTAPYYMQVYASTFIQPFIIPVGSGLTFDWAVPFAPGTQYQICMFDRFGVTGGCQSMYTMIKNATVSHPVCQNVTAAPQLSVEGIVAGGPMSQYGVINQCTDVILTPQSGKPPFILTAAPALHPPYNITSNTMDPITWTVSLSWAFPFFLSLIDADGKTWANGPMHSGGPGSSDCLAPGTIPGKTARGVAAGAGVGSLVAGLIIGVITAFVYRRRREKRSRKEIHGSYPFAPPPAYYNDRPLPPIPLNLSLRLPVWLKECRLFRNGQSRLGDNGLQPFTTPRPRVPLVEPKASAYPLVPVEVVRDDLRDRQSAYPESTVIESEPPPIYNPDSRLKKNPGSRLKVNN